MIGLIKNLLADLGDPLTSRIGYISDPAKTTGPICLTEHRWRDHLAHTARTYRDPHRARQGAGQNIRGENMSDHRVTVRFVVNADHATEAFNKVASALFVFLPSDDALDYEIDDDVEALNGQD